MPIKDLMVASVARLEMLCKAKFELEAQLKGLIFFPEELKNQLNIGSKI